MSYSYSAREMRRNGVYQWEVPGYEIEKRKTILVLRGAVAKSNKAPQIHVLYPVHSTIVKVFKVNCNHFCFFLIPVHFFLQKAFIKRVLKFSSPPPIFFDLHT
jgi:hypothetical protein